MKSSKMTASLIWLKQAQYRQQEGRWTLIVFLTCISYFVVVDLRNSGWEVCGIGGYSQIFFGYFCLYQIGPVEPSPTHEHPASGARPSMPSFSRNPRPDLHNFDMLNIDQKKKK